MVESLQYLLSLTAQARRSARAGDFHGLQGFIDQREEVLKKLGSSCQRPPNDVQDELARELSLCIEQLDREIVGLVREEMKHQSQDILEITTKLRVLATYSKGLSNTRRFDTML
ncbi:MAG TPA: hypothetical protein GX524_05275 [Firmicutes bacterium]|jgi:hypothetical protein|nr:hypothetical protein [Bacillota bacterium]